MVFRRKVVSIKRARAEGESAEGQPKAISESQNDTQSSDARGSDDARHSSLKTAPMYPSHLSSDEMEKGLSDGTMFQGTLHTSKRNSFYGHVLVKLTPEELMSRKLTMQQFVWEKLAPGTSHVAMKITFPNAEAINRAFHGDTVCVEIVPEDFEAAVNMPTEEENMQAVINEEYENEADGFYESHGGHKILEKTERKGVDSVKDSLSSASNEMYVKVVGKVRGILSQARRSFCGSLIAANHSHEESLEKNIHQDRHATSLQTNQEGSTHVSTYANAYTFLHQGQEATFSAENYFIFQPYNRCFPKMRVHVSRSLLHTMPFHVLTRTRFLVRFTEWEQGNIFPSANIISAIGEEGDIAVEEKVILFENNLIESVNVSTTDHNDYSKEEVQRIVHEFYHELRDWSSAKTSSGSAHSIFTPFFSIRDSTDTHRHDLRHLPIFSIDPQGCKDIDDALHCVPVDKEKLRTEILGTTSPEISANDRQLAESIVKATDDIYFCGIHIADVSHFVQEENAIDLEARRRGTSVYLVNKRINMIPSMLSEYLCSLQADEERFCFSVVFFITGSGEIITSDPSKREKMQSTDIDLSGIRIAKTLIKSCIQLSYEEAHEILLKESVTESQKEDKNGKVSSSLCSSLVGLHRIAASLRETRKESGAVFLSSPEFRFVFEDTENSFHPSHMVSARSEEPKKEESVSIDTHMLIEEFMLLANSIVARTLLLFHPQHSLLRNHLPPIADHTESQKSTNSVFDMMNQELEKKHRRICHRLEESGYPKPAFRLHVDSSSSKSLNASLAESISPIDPDFNHLLKLIVTRAMTRAHYVDSSSKDLSSADAFLHYGLALPCYTHFTSPIRRYADLVVHRILSSIFKFGPPPAFIRKNESFVGDDDTSSIRAASKKVNATTYENLTTLADHLNTRHEKAQNAGRESQKFFCKLYLLGLPDMSSSASAVDKLVLTNMKGYVIRKGKFSKGSDDQNQQEVIVMIPEINLEGELTYDNLESDSNVPILELFEELWVDVWIRNPRLCTKSTVQNGPLVELRLHRAN